MRKRLALLLMLATLGGLSATAGPIVAAPAQISCSSSYVSANLPWGHKCLRAGEFCKIGNRAYLRYGFVCPSTGHLRRRG
jgi:hypothetical protein